MQIVTRFNKVIAYNEGGYTLVGNSAVSNTTDECYDEASVITVNGVPTDIDDYEYYYIGGRFVKGDAKALNKRGDTMYGTLKVNGLILTPGEDYGDTLPESAVEGKVFFERVT